ncbi:MAG: hypothetical protein NUV56_00625 [Candidatus Uhrbacteria bacterium]|nr:hypothetical protein [Candidatus Uhrbacteria bacterium]
MFDDVPQKSTTPPPADMFAGVDPQGAAPTPPPVQAPASAIISPPPSAMKPMAPMPMLSSAESSGFGAGKILLVIVAGLLVLGTSGYIAYRFMVQPADGDSIVDAVSDDDVTEDDDEEVEGSQEGSGEVSDEESEEEEVRVNPATLLDSDGDGLSNAEELEYGTSVTKADTDGDGLGDREEVEVYDTDPKEVDTDGDTFLDGQEVAGGYNPNGPGRLFEVPEETK